MNTIEINRALQIVTVTNQRGKLKQIPFSDDVNQTLLTTSLIEASSMWDEVTLTDGVDIYTLPKSTDAINYPIYLNGELIGNVRHNYGMNHGEVTHVKAGIILNKLKEQTNGTIHRG